MWDSMYLIDFVVSVLGRHCCLCNELAIKIRFLLGILPIHWIIKLVAFEMEVYKCIVFHLQGLHVFPGRRALIKYCNKTHILMHNSFFLLT